LSQEAINIIMRLSDIIQEGFGFWQDNPALRAGEDGEYGAEWVREKQEDAEYYAEGRTHGIRGRMLTGSVTAAMGQHELMLFPSQVLASIEGVMGENRRPGDLQYDSLIKRIQANGYENKIEHAVLVGVNHKGEAYVIEGNTRAAVAVTLGIPFIPAEFRWFNGAETIDGKWSPATVAALSVRSKE
jgi:hypothetical protein